jgi:hypothetical protein
MGHDQNSKNLVLDWSERVLKATRLEDVLH